MAALSNHKHPHKYGSMAHREMAPKRLFSALGGTRHSTGPVALRADMTGMDKLPVKHPEYSSKGSASPLLCNVQQRIQISSCETFVTRKKPHQKSEPVVLLRNELSMRRLEYT